MADRTLTARLRSIFDSKGTDDAKKGLRGVGEEGKKTSQSTGRDFEKLGKSMTDLGDSMTKKLTLPIVGVGVVATKMSMDFDNAFTQMQTLAGVSGDAVAGMKDEVLKLAGETGKAPQELADAMYFLASSGLEGKEAMDALTVSAKASAAGLGPTEVIADAVSSAMLGYAESGLKASEATDVLIATARAGKAEPAELASQMGRLIPTAAELGIKFADVGGAIAALSTKGNDAAAATTQLTNVMGKLMKPSQQANEALEGVGLSTDRIRDLISEKGLLGTLEVLKDRLGDSGFVKFFEDQQAVQGALALTGGDLEKTRGIFEDVNDSVGATDEAFGTWAESMGAKNAKAFADFQVALIQLGDVIAPIAADLLSFAGDLATKFADLPRPILDVVVGLGALVAAAGPVISVGGRVVTFITQMKKAASQVKSVTDSFGGLKGSAAALGSAGGPLAVLVGSVVALDKAFDALFPIEHADLPKLENDLVRFNESGALAGEAADLLGDDFDKLRTATKDIFDPSTADQLGHIGDEIITVGGKFQGEHRHLEESKKLFEDLDAALVQLAGRSPEAAAAVFESISEEMQDAGATSKETQEIFKGYNDTLIEADTANRTAEGGTESNTEAIADQEQQVNEASAAYQEYADTLKAITDPVFGVLHALRKNDEAQRNVEESLTALNDARKEHGRNSAEARDAEIAYQDALLATGESARDVEVAAAGLNAAVAENPALLDSAKSALETWVDQGLITQDQARYLADQFDITALKSAALGETDPNVNVTETGNANTRAELRKTKDAATDIPPHRNTHVTSSGTSSAADQIGRVLSLLGQVHDKDVTIRVHTAGASIGATLAQLSGHAGGGSVRKGEPSIVGEKGWEVFVPDSNGKILNQQQLAALSGPMTSGALYDGGGATYVFNFPNLIHPDSRAFRSMVVKAVNTADRKGRSLNAA